MMKLFAVYDSKVEAYMNPFVARTAGEAVRMFENAANGEDHKFAQHAGDYTLFELGEWHDDVGTVVMHTAKVNLGTALEHRRNVVPVRQADSMADADGVVPIQDKKVS